MKFLNVTESDAVLRVGLNRPDKKNAFHPEMIREIQSVFQNIKVPKIRAVWFYGEGDAFCAGADLEYMKSMSKFSLEQNAKDADELYNMFLQIAEAPVPVLGQFHGHAFGGAVGLAAVCDYGAAEMNTQFCLSETKLGLVPAVISSFVVAKVGLNQAKRLMLNAQIFNATHAKEIDLVDFVGSKIETTTYIESQIKLIKLCGPEAVMHTKRLLKSVTEVDNNLRQKCVQTIAERRVSVEGQEGLSSFLERRSPQWVKQ